MPTRSSRVAESAEDALAYVAWVEHLLWRSTLDLAPGDASFNEIAAAVGVEPPVLSPGDSYTDDLGTAQLYWPLPGPTAVPAARSGDGEDQHDDQHDPQPMQTDAAEDQRQEEQYQE